MNEPTQHELISAYLDGELTADEQDRAEALLAESSEARASLDELRTLSQTLQGMPRYKLGVDLSQAVIRQAMEVQAAANNGQPIPGASTSASSLPQTSLATRQRFTWRTLAWPAMTAAAAILLMVAWPNPAPEVAKHDPAAAGRAGEIDDVADASGDRREHLIEPPPDDVEKSFASKSLQPGPPSAAVDESLRHEELEGAKNRALDVDEGSFAKKIAGGEWDKKGDDALAVQDAEQSVAENGAIQRGAAVEALGGATPAAPGSARQSALQRKRNEIDAQLGQVYRDADANLASGRRANAVDNDLVVVFCDVRPGEVAPRDFDRILAQQGIAWQSGATKESKGQYEQRYAHRASQPHGESDALTQDSTDVRPGGGFGGQDEQVVDMVLVEAPAAQVEATLADLAARPEQFVSVNVQPAPGYAAQQPLTHYNRGYGFDVAPTTRTAQPAPTNQAPRPPVGDGASPATAETDAPEPAARPSDDAAGFDPSPAAPAQEEAEEFQNDSFANDKAQARADALTARNWNGRARRVVLPPAASDLRSKLDRLPADVLAEELGQKHKDSQEFDDAHDSYDAAVGDSPPSSRKPSELADLPAAEMRVLFVIRAIEPEAHAQEAGK